MLGNFMWLTRLPKSYKQSAESFHIKAESGKDSWVLLHFILLYVSLVFWNQFSHWPCWGENPVFHELEDVEKRRFFKTSSMKKCPVR